MTRTGLPTVRSLALALSALLALASCHLVTEARLRQASRQLAVQQPVPRGRPPSDGKPDSVCTREFWDRAATRPKFEREFLRDADGREQSHGFERRWYDDGQLEYERYFERGEPSGKWRSWYPSGQLESEAEYLADALAPLRWWYPDGQLSAQGATRGGVREGAWRTWHPNGQLACEGEMLAGRRHGDWAFYQEDGALHSRGRYEQGAKVGTWEYAPGLESEPPENSDHFSGRSSPAHRGRG